MRRKSHSKSKAKRGPKNKDKGHKKQVEDAGGRRGMDVAAYVLAALAGILFVLVGLFYSEHKTPSILLFGVACITLTIAACLYWIHAVSPSPPPETQTTGVLVPANEPDPPFPPNCRKPPDSWAVFCGSSVAFSTNPELTVIQTAGHQLLVASRTAEGLSISARIYSPDGRIIAEIDNNEFTINQNNYFKRDRPDKSTLVVYDQYNTPVLNVRYLNPTTVKVMGTFRYGNRPPIVIDETTTQIGGMTIKGFCFGNTAVAFSN
jgi:hypothetical protein